jgi:hypothetical protein
LASLDTNGLLYWLRSIRIAELRRPGANSGDGPDYLAMCVGSIVVPDTDVTGLGQKTRVHAPCPIRPEKRGIARWRWKWKFGCAAFVRPSGTIGYSS